MQEVQTSKLASKPLTHSLQQKRNHQDYRPHGVRRASVPSCNHVALASPARAKDTVSASLAPPSFKAHPSPFPHVAAGTAPSYHARHPDLHPHPTSVAGSFNKGVPRRAGLPGLALPCPPVELLFAFVLYRKTLLCGGGRAFLPADTLEATRCGAALTAQPPRYTSLFGATTHRPTRGWFLYLGMRAG